MNPGFPEITTFEKPRRIDMMEMVPSSFASCFSTKRERGKEGEGREGHLVIKCMSKHFLIFLGF